MNLLLLHAHFLIYHSTCLPALDLLFIFAYMPLWGGMITSKHRVHFRHSASEMSVSSLLVRTLGNYFQSSPVDTFQGLSIICTQF
uniref:Uncharacterized protein n=1 Tax=Picea sitchensis TaxID=3332 RepID=D5ACU7_PICSI|nr:unknown [Picea sitchensis]